MPTDPSARAADLELAQSAEPADPCLVPSPADVVVFDLGNVLIRWDPHPAIAAAVGDEQARRFLARGGGATGFDFSAWNHRQDEGRPWEEAEEAAIRAHPRWEGAIRAYRENFDASLTGEISDSVQILRELHAAGVPLFALTNWSAELFPRALRRFAFLDLFEDIVVSGAEKVAKPDPQIWEVLRQRVRRAGGLEDCVFIDDNPANIVSATAAGLDAILFTDTGHLREELRARGLPLAAT